MTTDRYYVIPNRPSLLFGFVPTTILTIQEPKLDLVVDRNALDNPLHDEESEYCEYQKSDHHLPLV